MSVSQQSSVAAPNLAASRLSKGELEMRRIFAATLVLALGATLAFATVAAAETIRGTQGNDVLLGTPGPDRIIALGGADIITGGGGNDLLKAGRGTDIVDAGDGDDAVFSRDGEADEINCGAGEDTVQADVFDTLTGCEDAKVA